MSTVRFCRLGFAGDIAMCCVSHFEASMVSAARQGAPQPPCWLRNAHAARALRAAAQSAGFQQSRPGGALPPCPRTLLQHCGLRAPDHGCAPEMSTTDPQLTTLRADLHHTLKV